jgi:hypothetical protein
MAMFGIINADVFTYSFSFVSRMRCYVLSILLSTSPLGTVLRMSLVEQELLTLPEHLSSPPVFSVDRCLSFCAFSFGHCVVCSFSIYGF